MLNFGDLEIVNGTEIFIHRRQMLPQEPPIKQDLPNRHTLKLSHSCMPNMKAIIASHKKEILSNVATIPNQNHDPSCNCRKKAECSLMVNASKRTTVTTTTTTTTTESYVGLASNFKEDQRTIPKPQHILTRRQQTQCKGTI